MPIKVSGKNIEVGESLQKFAVETFQACIEKYKTHMSEAHITFGKEGTSFQTDLTVHLGKHMHVHCSCCHHDPYQSVTDVIGKLKTRLQKYKTRLRNHSKEETSAYQYILDSNDDNQESDTPIIIAENQTTIPSLSVSEAVMHLDLSNAVYFLFNNTRTQKINLVYKRPDGHIGWVDPT